MSRSKGVRGAILGCLVLTGLLFGPADVMAQERRAVTFDQLVALVEGRVPTGTIPSTIEADCLGFFELTPDMEGRLRSAGAEPRLLEGLRTICRVFPEGMVEEPFAPWLLVGEPDEWVGATPMTVAVGAGTRLRVAGRAFAPGGIERVEVAGVRAQVSEGTDGASRFVAEIPVAAGTGPVQVVLYPREGSQVRHTLPIQVAGAAEATPRPSTSPARAAGAAAEPYNPGTVAVSGLLVPGLAQFRTGNAPLGVVILAAAGGSLAAGLLSTETRVRCAANADPCPASAVLNEDVSRPFLVPGLAAAVGISAVGAVLGFNAARSANERARRGLGLELGGDAGTPVLFLAPLVAAAPSGGVRIELARLTF